MNAAEQLPDGVGAGPFLAWVERRACDFGRAEHPPIPALSATMLWANASATWRMIRSTNSPGEGSPGRIEVLGQVCALAEPAAMAISRACRASVMFPPWRGRFMPDLIHS